MRTGFNAHRQPFGFCTAQHVQCPTRRQMYDVQPEIVFAAEGDHELNRRKLRFIRPRLQIRLILAPVRMRQSLCCGVHRSRQFRMNQQRQAGPRDMRQGRAELLLADHGEAIDARVNEKTLETRDAGGCQVFDVLLVVAYNSAPRHPVHLALIVRGLAFCFECSDRRRCRQTVEWHVHEQRAAAGCGGPGGRPESLPFRAPGFVDVDVRVHQPRQNGGLAKVRRANLRGQFMR